MNEDMKKEYGGFLPLELNKGDEYFLNYNDNTLRYNTVKAALSAVIQKIKPKKILIPYYYCPTTIEAIKAEGIQVDFFHIDESLLPIDLPDKEGNLLIIVNYFGLISNAIYQIAKSIKFADVIIDQAHSFFDEPYMKARIYNIYSAKKFFGVPDGAYLIGDAIKSIQQPEVYSSDYAQYLLKTYEEGTNAAYIEKKNIDSMIGSKYLPMSKLTIGILKNIDYKRVEFQRRKNFRILQNSFIGINKLGLPIECPAYHFPLLTDNGGDIVKKELIAKKIYVPTLWTGEDLKDQGSDFEKSIARNCIFLPVDQRYDEDDMSYIASEVKEIVKKYENFRYNIKRWQLCS